jgi:hypothetical protein
MLPRRTFIATAALPLMACTTAPVQTFPTIASALKAVEGLADVAQGWRSNGAFSLAQMLNHAAQSVEFSLRGFPELKSAAFRRTVGAAAFALFDARGTMSHSLSEPIPGAPPLLATQALDQGILRFTQALREFDANTQPLAPHFAYGALDKAQFTRAHLMHLANHWTELARTPISTTITTTPETLK